LLIYLPAGAGFLVNTRIARTYARTFFLFSCFQHLKKKKTGGATGVSIVSPVVLCRFFLFQYDFALKTKNIFYIYYVKYILSIFFSFLSLFFQQKEKIG